MADLLTPALLAAIDWGEYKRYGHELPPSTVDWIKHAKWWFHSVLGRA